MLSEDELKTLARGFRDAVAARLDALIPAEDAPPLDLHRSMRHTLMAPGKKVRALLTLFVARHVGANESAAVSPACALEMVHAASLILDDLPAMDNASLRRGLPANHQLFGDATAILAAIGLLSRGFGVLAEDDGLPSEARVRLSDILSRAIGSEGLIAGQELDLKWSAQGATRQDVALIHARKTAALFAAAAEMGAVAGAADDDHAACLRQFGMKLGLAFQILDDLLDATGTEASTGKNVGQDEGRPSLVLTIGQAAAQREAALLVEEALALIPEPGRGDGALRQFAMWLIAGLEAKLRVAGC